MDYKLPFFLKLKQIIIIAFFLVLVNCYRKNCEQLPETFETYKQAEEAIQRAKYEYRDSIDLSESSWLAWAEYLSCDGKTGYFIYETKKGEVYIHQNLPVEIWQSFISATSKGSYYVKNIKNRYRLKID